jgi:hypothetical protein
MRTSHALSIPLPHLWISLFFLTTILMAVSGRAGALNLGYPVAAVSIGWWLQTRYRSAFVAFVLLLWIITPEVRRLVDFQTGWHAFSPVAVTPMLVTMIVTGDILLYAGALTRRQCFPFVLCLFAVAYAFVVGLVQNSLVATVYDLGVWGIPVVFGLYLAIQRDSLEHVWRAFESSLVWGMAISGLYALVQFFYLPGWDRFWMENADINSVGSALATDFRVFGSMNSPGTFSLFCMAALLVSCASQTPGRILAAVPTALSLALSLVRSSWLGLLTGFAVLLIVSPGRSRLRLITLVAVTAAIMLPLLAEPHIATTFFPRLDSLISLQHDNSYLDRSEFYAKFLDRALFNVGGQGLGSTGLATKLDNHGLMGELGNFDSGVMNIPFVLGWPGFVLFLSGLVMLFGLTARARFTQTGSSQRCAAAIAVGIVIQLVGSNVLFGAEGLLFWAALAMTATDGARATAAGKSSATWQQMGALR